MYDNNAYKAYISVTRTYGVDTILRIRTMVGMYYIYKCLRRAARSRWTRRDGRETWTPARPLRRRRSASEAVVPWERNVQKKTHTPMGFADGGVQMKRKRKKVLGPVDDRARRLVWLADKHRGKRHVRHTR